MPPTDCVIRRITSWLPMDELQAVCRAPIKTCFPDAQLRSGNKRKPQHSDESKEVEGTFVEEDQD